MKKLITSISGMLILLSSCSSNSEQTKEAQRIVSLNGAITETIASLGQASELVGVDVTSTFPDSIKNIAQDLGHVRSITFEPILALNPTLILATEKDLNPDLLAKIEASGVLLKLVRQEYSVEGAKSLISQVATSLGQKENTQLAQDMDKSLVQIQKLENTPKILFVYARGAGTLQVAGENTPFEEIIELAGGQNAIKGFTDFKPLTAEALVESNPDIILMFDSGLKSLGGIDGILEVPGMKKTNAGKNKAVINLDGGLISNFGPRTGEAALALNKEILKLSK